jgi:Protein of unknown function (DUF2892)
MSFDYKRMIKFEHNVGCKDKQRRVYTGSAALLVSVFIASIPLLLIGLILVATGYFGWCPVYSGLNRNTNEAGDVTEKVAEEAAH